MTNLQKPTPAKTKPVLETPEEIGERIRQRAYQLYEQRGKADGHDLDDWLTAESEVSPKSQAKAA